VAGRHSRGAAHAGTLAPLLLAQQQWVVHLRWLAGIAIISLGTIDAATLQLYARPWHFLLVGLVVLAYNTFIAWQLRRSSATHWSRARLTRLVWTQILPDLACLTALTLWTGAYASPLRGFYVFHMVFASLLLRRNMALAVAGVAIILLEGSSLLFVGVTPTRNELLYAAGSDVTLLVTVYLANKITRQLRRQRRDLIRKNAKIRRMSARLKKHQQVLMQTEKMNAMGHMAAGIAHEVANPLASMDGLLQLIERRPESLKPETVSRLREQVARINGIVRQLTNFAHPGRLGANSSSEDRTEANGWRTGSLNDVVRAALEVARFDRRMKSVQVQQDLAGDLPPVMMQPDALQQVVLNLVINALDAMANLPNARLLVRSCTRDGGATLDIHDTGHGVPAKIAARIFEPFFTTKPVGQGTGLGLSISYSIVAKHGGRLSVASPSTQFGSGSCFTLTIPAIPAADSQPREAKTSPVSEVEKSG